MEPKNKTYIRPETSAIRFRTQSLCDSSASNLDCVNYRYGDWEIEEE